MKSTGLVVSEHLALVRDGLVSLLSGAWTHGAVRAAASLDETVTLLADDAKCVLLLDLGLLGASGPAGLIGLRTRFPALRIVVLTGQETRDGILQCLSAGAHGYVATSAPFAELLRAVEVVRDGGVHVPLALAASGMEAFPPAALSDGAARVDLLTGRQRDVLLLMAEGRSTKDIARTLDLAVSTIKVHLAAVYRVVGARNRVEALCRAGLLPDRRFVHSAM
jgi:DNA-binding NarL/FixJ family response regulator